MLQDDNCQCFVDVNTSSVEDAERVQKMFAYIITTSFFFLSHFYPEFSFQCSDLRWTEAIMTSIWVFSDVGAHNVSLGVGAAGDHYIQQVDLT